jgi:hypothetical protein
MSSNWSLTISFWVFLSVFALMFLLGCCSVFGGIPPLKVFDCCWWGTRGCFDCWGCCGLPCCANGLPLGKTKLVPVKEPTPPKEPASNTAPPQVVYLQPPAGPVSSDAELRPRVATPAVEELEDGEQYPLLVLSRKSSTGFRETFHGVESV